jgi:class 3 adenylate cyclase
VSTRSDVESEVHEIVSTVWTETETDSVPEPEDLSLGNQAKHLEGTVLYADLAGSTAMVDGYTWEFSAEVYKAFLYAAAKVIRSECGEIVAYDGDRVMAVFVGESKNTSAVRGALKINWAVKNLVTPAFKKQYSTLPASFSIDHVVGIDTSDLRAARTGIRGANDLVWVGKAANHAAKLTELSAHTPTWITPAVYESMNESVRIGGDKLDMWRRQWRPNGAGAVYGSTYWWELT